MQIGRIPSPGIFICLSAFLLVFGTHLATMEVPVRITYDPAAAEQYDLIRAYLPFGSILWILAIIFLVCGFVLGVRKPLAVATLKKPFSIASIVVSLTLGFLALTSIYLPWVIAERTETFIETRGGTFNIGRYYALTGLDLMTRMNDMAGDAILFVLAGAMISILHIPLLSLLWKEGTDVTRVFLFLSGGTCIISSVASIYAHRVWWISLHVNGALGFPVMSEGLGLGFIIATLCAIGLIAFGIIAAIKLVR